jgi:hypothetical protein
MKNYIYLDGVKTELQEDDTRMLRKYFTRRTPCPIKMAYIPGSDDVAIPFGKQVLYFDHHSETFGVRALMGLDLIPCDLIPCKREDLKPGDTAFRDDEGSPDFDDLELYCKILNDRRHVGVHDYGVSFSSNEWNYWWKVVPR